MQHLCAVCLCACEIIQSDVQNDDGDVAMRLLRCLWMAAVAFCWGRISSIWWSKMLTNTRFLDKKPTALVASCLFSTKALFNNEKTSLEKHKVTLTRVIWEILWFMTYSTECAARHWSKQRGVDDDVLFISLQPLFTATMFWKCFGICESKCLTSVRCSTPQDIRKTQPQHFTDEPDYIHQTHVLTWLQASGCLNSVELISHDCIDWEKLQILIYSGLSNTAFLKVWECVVSSEYCTLCSKARKGSRGTAPVSRGLGFWTSGGSSVTLFLFLLGGTGAGLGTGYDTKTNHYRVIFTKRTVGILFKVCFCHSRHITQNIPAVSGHRCMWWSGRGLF